MQLFQFAIWLDEKLDKDGEVVEPAKILVEPTTMLAEDEKHVGIRASKMIPDQYDDCLERVQIVIRPF